MVRVLVPTSGGINNSRSKQKIPNMVSKIPSGGGGGGGGDDAKTLSGQVRSDPRVNPMMGDMPFMRGLMTYDLANQNRPCVDIQQMGVGMMGGYAMNPNKTDGSESMFARSLPSNGNRPSIAWGACDVKNLNPAGIEKRLQSANNWQPMGLPPPFPKLKGVQMVK